MILTDVIKVFRKGGMIKDPASWKNRDVTTGTIFSILVILTGLARFFGVDLPLTDETLTLIATGIAALLAAAHAIITMITSKKVGLPGLAPVVEEPIKVTDRRFSETPEYIRAIQEALKIKDEAVINTHIDTYAKKQTMGHDY